MASKRIPSLRCPTCRKVVTKSDAEFPFCCERCRLIDLGKWASGGYVISTPLNDPEDVDAPAPNSRRMSNEQRNPDSGSKPDSHSNERNRIH